MGANLSEIDCTMSFCTPNYPQNNLLKLVLLALVLLHALRRGIVGQMGILIFQK